MNITNINAKLLLDLKTTIVACHIFYKADPRGAFQTYFDCVEGLREEVLEEWFETALADLNPEALISMLKDSNFSEVKYDDNTKDWYIQLIAQTLMFDNKTKYIEAIQKLIEHNKPSIVFITKEGETNGKNIVRQAICGNYVVTEFTGNCYQVITMSTTGMVYKNNIPYFDLQNMFDSSNKNAA
jgi:hypothetical protein